MLHDAANCGCATLADFFCFLRAHCQEDLDEPGIDGRDHDVLNGIRQLLEHPRQGRQESSVAQMHGERVEHDTDGIAVQ
eukprot:scaffold2448_cov250-Pinguiococcus_pyrenoidosus.AAC.12